MSASLDSMTFYDSAAFVLPPKVAKMDAVRRLIPRLMEVTGLGETAATTVAQAVVDPTAVRAALAEPLPGLTAHRESHLQVIRTRVWIPWVTPPADDVPRYRSRKRYPISSSDIPRVPRPEETRDGLTLTWESPADRAWHLRDNEELYDSDTHAGRERIRPEKGGIFAPVVLVPQVESFRDGSESLHLLRLVDGCRRFYAADELLRGFAELGDLEMAHVGDGLTPEIFRAALRRDRSALGKVVAAVRDACTTAGYVGGRQQYVGVHYLASVLSVPACIVVGTTDPTTGEVRPMGTSIGYPTDVVYTLNAGVAAWHCGSPARVVATGQKEYNGLLLPEAAVDTELIDTTVKRLRARGVAKEIAEFGVKPDKRAAARFTWWTRAIRQLGGAPATAVAAFALHSKGPLPQNISRSLLACASYVMEEDFDIVYPPGDYRDSESRPDSLTLLVGDAKDLAVAALSSEGRGRLLAHPRWRNAAHIALAHLALIGALPAQEPLPDRIVRNPRLLSQVALSWASGRFPTPFVRPDGEVYRDEGRVVPIDERTLTRDDLPWPKPWEADLTYMMPPAVKHPYNASHVFTLRHGDGAVVFAIPTEPLESLKVEATPESIARVVRRWFPDATGITLTDWSDKLVTGVTVGSVWVQLYDRQFEQDEARSRGVWYPQGRPAGVKDVIDFDSANSGVPVGEVLGATDLTVFSIETVEDAVEAMCAELSDEIINEIDEALERQKAADTENGKAPNVYGTIPVLRLPEIKRRDKQ